MKRLSMIGMAALLLLAMSCKKNEEKPLGGEVCFRASIETPSGTGKTHLADNGHTVLWDANDAITVVNGQETPVAWDFTVVNISEDGRKADFVSDEHGVPEGFFTPDYKAYYPASMYDKATGKVSLPSEQVYKAGSFYPGYNPMAAQSDDENLYFKNICGVLMLQLTGRCTVDNITITSRGESKLWGTAEITMEDDKYDEAMTPTLGTLEGGGKTLTLKCNNAVTLKPDEATAFYFVLPPGSLSDGFEVVMTTSDGDVWTRATSANISIEASHIKKMGTLNVFTSGLFTVSAGPDGQQGTPDDKKVIFSPGNLQYIGSAIPPYWKFADRQEEFIGEEQQGASVSINRDLFGWGDLTGYNTLGDYRQYYSWTDDWGSLMGDGWRTLTCDEWDYLIFKRKINGKTGFGNTCVLTTINDVYGLLIFHDDYMGSTTGITAIPDGCVFLPASGDRGYQSGVGTQCTKIDHIGERGYYWSSTRCPGTYSAYTLLFPNENSNVPYGPFCIGRSVRLVKDYVEEP